MEFEDFKEIDQVKPNERENEEKGGINIKHENSLSLFKMSNMANLQKAKVSVIFLTLSPEDKLLLSWVSNRPHPKIFTLSSFWNLTKVHWKTI
jgi:hypothetical protein